jgi:hypothetical protein
MVAVVLFISVTTGLLVWGGLTPWLLERTVFGMGQVGRQGRERRYSLLAGGGQGSELKMENEVDRV